MTSAQTMQEGAPFDGAPRFSHSVVRSLWTLAFASVIATLPGCDSLFQPKLQQPETLVAPYSERQVWAVAPFINESGVSIVAGDKVADAFTTEAESIQGIDTLPVNRVIAAMRRLNLNAITTPNQARMLLTALGADGLIVGTVTAFDPYQPPKFGASVALFTGASATAHTIDPVQVTRARTDDVAPGAMPSNAPSAQASGIFDAGNQQTLIWLGEYSAGRSEPDSAYGERIYLVRMDLYTQFAAFRLLHDLLDSEQARLAPVQAAAGSQGKADGTEHAPSH